MKRKAKKLSLLLAITLLFGSIFSSIASAASVEPEYVSGNTPKTMDGMKEFKLEDLDNLQINVPTVFDDGDIEVTITITQKKDNKESIEFDFSANKVVYYVAVKAGNGYNLYYYEDGTMSDTGLVSPDSKGISHVSFYFGEEDDPEPEWKGNIIVYKEVEDENNENPSLEGFLIELWKDGKKVNSGYTDENGQVEFNDLAEGTYTIKEKLGDQADEYDVTIDNNGVVVLTEENDNDDYFEITVKNTKKYDDPDPDPEWKGNIIVYKEVEDENNENPSLEGFLIELWKDGNKINSGYTDENGEVEFTDLAEGTYTIIENLGEDADKYDVTIDNNGVVELTEENDNDDYFEITVKNTKKYDDPDPDPEWKGTIRVKKVVVDEGNENPSLEGFLIEVWQGERKVAYGETNEEGEVEFTDLAEGTYTIIENLGDLADKYDVTIDNNGVVILKEDNENDNIFEITVTNTAVNEEIEKIDITGTKVWIGGPRSKPQIRLQLYRDGEAYGEEVTLENGETSYTWKGLDKTDEEGNEYKYTIDEVNVPRNYIKSISEDGLMITNRYNPPSDRDDPDEPEPQDPDDEEEEIPDEEVPLGGGDPIVPVDAEPEVLEEIIEPEVPLATTLPDTGAFMNTSILAAIGSTFVLSGIVIGRKKRK